MLIIIIIFLLILIFVKLKNNEIARKKITIIFVLLFLLWGGYFIFYKNNFTNSIYVVTENETSKKIVYYEVNDRNYKRVVDKFNYQENEVINFRNCFKSYIDKDKNKVLNRKIDECSVIDNNYNEIQPDDRINDVIDKISELEHDIIKASIIKTDKNDYVLVSFNVNLWTPYKLYRYENNKLKRIYTFDGENVIGIKE